MTLARRLAWPFALLSLTLLLFESTGLDLWVQDLFYDAAARQWWIHKDDPVPRLIFYTGAKRAIIVFGLVVLAACVASFRRESLKPHRRRLLLLTLALILVPGIVAGSKNVTNVHCPWAMDRYDGDQPYVRVLEGHPPGDYPRRTGKCFPAGHPTGGFALMALFFVFPGRRARRGGLALGLTLGWIMGLFQMLKGAHFLSHVIISMIASWMVIVAIDGLLERWMGKPFPEPVAGVDKNGS